MSSLRVDLRDPSKNWLTVRVTDGAVAQEDDVSLVPTDGVAELVDVLLRIAEGSPSEVHRWNLEPAEWTWTFSASGDARVTVRCEHPGHPALEAEIDRSGFVTLFWRSLRRLETNPEGQKERLHPFPSEALARLGKRARADRAGARPGRTDSP